MGDWIGAKMRNRWMLISIVIAVSIAGIVKYCSDTPVLFSSQLSPNGVWMAENYGYLYSEQGGYITLKRANDSSFSFYKSEKSIHFPFTTPALFFIWRDDQHLTIAQPSNEPRISNNADFEGVQLSYLTYPSDGHWPFHGRREVARDLGEDAISATFNEKNGPTPNRKICALDLAGADGEVYDHIGITITASVGPCNPALGEIKFCGGISSKFYVGQRKDHQYGQLLTSATLFNIPSFNRVPDGFGYTNLRGQFVENSATELVEDLKMATFEAQYSFNFDDTIITYRMPTRRISSVIQNFLQCTRNADFSWITHSYQRANGQ